MKTEKKFTLAGMLILAVMMVTAVIPFLMTSWMQSAQKEIDASHSRSEHLEDMLSLMKDAEAGQRGFIITGNDVFLEPYYTAVDKLAQAKLILQGMSSASPTWPWIRAKLLELADQRLASLAQAIELRRSKGFEAAEEAVTSAKGKAYMDELRQVIGMEMTREGQRIAAMQAEMHERAEIATLTDFVVTLVNFSLLVLLLVLMIKLLRERNEIGDALRASANDLAAGMSELERRNREISTIAQMSRALDSTLSTSETFGIIAVYCAKLLPQSSGALYMFRNSRDFLEMAADWGQPTDAAHDFEPQACWALRRGQSHLATGAHDLCCPHYQASHKAERHLCIPLTAQGEVLGLMYVEMAAGAPAEAQREEELAKTVAEQIALAVSNCRLRETLRHQSIIDPLTGLFNRRYLDETLKRELARSARSQQSLAVLMLDIDHFKKVNDTYGHDAGDLVLRTIGTQLKTGIRDSDIACRYGGEELVLIMPDCDREAALERAEKIRASIELLEYQHGEQHIARITASIGVAIFPPHGDTPQTLIQSADQALYAAKHAGRNRVMPAS